VSRFAARSNVLLSLAAVLAVVSLGMAVAVPVHSARAAATPEADRDLARRTLAMPVKGVKASELRDNFEEGRGKRKHEAIDILAPRGTPVVAVEDGRVAKLFTSAAGGLTVYQYDPGEKFIYYYAHLDRYAEGLKEGMKVKRGDLVGYVGTSGNAPKGTPHLHFAIFEAGTEKKWWKGTAVNPYPYLARAEAPPGG
jgi:peptidoglycan LD-endopeptidase LytH